MKSSPEQKGITARLSQFPDTFAYLFILFGLLDYLCLFAAVLIYLVTRLESLLLLVPFFVFGTLTLIVMKFAPSTNIRNLLISKDGRPLWFEIAVNLSFGTVIGITLAMIFNK